MFQGQGPRLVPHLRVMQDTKEFPFKCVLSMGPLVRYWAGLVASQEPTVSKIASDVMRRLERAPELAQPITDPKAIQTHESLIKVMMSNYVLKVLWEVVNTPITYRIVDFLKRAENEDYYDRGTNFTPFSLET